MPKKRFRVKVVKLNSLGGVYELRLSGGSRYAESTKRGPAEREAAKLEEELNHPRHTVLSWQGATRLYVQLHMREWSKSHRNTWDSTRRRFEAWCEGKPPDIDAIGNAMLADFALDLSEEVKPETARTYCRYLRGFFNWCEQQEWIDRAPTVKMPRRKRGYRKARGRPLTGEEFERMLMAIPKVLPDYAPSWEFVVLGLWVSSLRLGEAVQLHWTEPPVRVQFPYVVFDFGDKGNHGYLPIAREFWELIEPTAHEGYVFNPRLSKGITRSRDTWCHKIGDFGRRAGVKVSDTKFASAHDLRRSFINNLRLAGTSMDDVREFARHESESTTRGYYLDSGAERLAAAIWGADVAKLPKS